MIHQFHPIPLYIFGTLLMMLMAVQVPLGQCYTPLSSTWWLRAGLLRHTFLSVEPHLIPNQNGRQTTKPQGFFLGGWRKHHYEFISFKNYCAHLCTLDAFVHEQHKLWSVVSGLIIYLFHRLLECHHRYWYSAFLNNFVYSMWPGNELFKHNYTNLLFLYHHWDVYIC